MNVEATTSSRRLPTAGGENEEGHMFPNLTAELAAQRQADLVRTAGRYYRADDTPRTPGADALNAWARSIRQSLSHHRPVVARTASPQSGSSTPCCA
jgi:hypothetical protein